MIGNDERVRRTEMFQRWMEKRGRMQRGIAGLLVFPALFLALAACAFWFHYYLPVPLTWILGFLALTALGFAVCVILALVKLKRLSEGDRIMWKMRLDEPGNS